MPARRVEEAPREKMARRYAITAAHQQRLAVALKRETMPERTHDVHRVASLDGVKRSRTTSDRLVEHRHLAVLGVKDAKGTPQSARLQCWHLHVHELSRHQLRRHLRRLQHEIPISGSDVRMFNNLALFVYHNSNP